MIVNCQNFVSLESFRSLANSDGQSQCPPVKTRGTRVQNVLYATQIILQMSLCAANKLELCEIKWRRGGVQPFVCREMVEMILKYVKKVSR